MVEAEPTRYHRRPMPTIAVFGGSEPTPDDPTYRAAHRLGGLLAESGFTVATGGYAGVMAAASRGAAERGGTVIGVTAPALFPDRSGANPWVSIERPHASLTERIHDLVTMSDGVVAMPGSIGTLTELMVAWNDAFIARLGSRPARPVVTVGERWRTLIPELTDRLRTDGSLIHTVDTVDQAHRWLVTRFADRPS